MVSASVSLKGSKYEFVTLLAPQEIIREQPFTFKKFNIQTNFLKTTSQRRSSQVWSL